MNNRTKIELRRSEIRSRLGEVSGLTGDALTEEITKERDALMKELADTEPQLRAAIEAEGEELQTRAVESELKPEERERLELRGKASLGNYLAAAIRGRQVNGAEAELQEASGCDGIPIELWETREVLEKRAQSQTGIEKRAITAAPGTVGINLDVIRPAVFAPSIADKLQIEMPMVESGTYATGTITTSVPADAVAKSADVPNTAGAITTMSTGPKRVGARLELTLEDVAAVGQANFESVLRENVSLALSDELDSQMINGAGSSDDLTGIFERLTNPSAPAANVETWERFLAIQSSGIDGLWATMLSHIAMVTNPETYRLMASTVRAGNAADQTALEHLTQVGDSVWTNKRMPDKAANIAQGILCRKGRMGMRMAVCPHWGYIGIDDIYSGSRKGERYFTLSVLVGDVILVQPDAYAQVAFRVST